jgi:hypothetical protein
MPKDIEFVATFPRRMNAIPKTQVVKKRGFAKMYLSYEHVSYLKNERPGCTDVVKLTTGPRNGYFHSIKSVQGEGETKFHVD